MKLSKTGLSSTGPSKTGPNKTSTPHPLLTSKKQDDHRKSGLHAQFCSHADIDSEVIMAGAK
jgi:hypothetical protein